MIGKLIAIMDRRHEIYRKRLVRWISRSAGPDQRTVFVARETLAEIGTGLCRSKCSLAMLPA